MQASFAVIDQFRRAGTETEQNVLNNEYKLISRNLEKLPRLSLANLPSMKVSVDQQEKVIIKKELQFLKDSPTKDYTIGLKSLMNRLTPRKLDPVNIVTIKSPDQLQYPLTERRSERQSPVYSEKISKTKDTQPNIITRAGFKTKSFGKSKQINSSTIVKPNLCGRKGNFLFAISEGHGPHGKMVSESIKKNFPNIIESEIKIDDKPEEIKRKLKNIDQDIIEVLKNLNQEINFSSSSLLTAVIIKDSLYLSNIGTCTAVLAKFDGDWTSNQLCSRHNLKNKTEQRRVKALGAKIFTTPEGSVVFSNGKGPIFEQTRGIGNLVGKSFGISSEGEVFELSLKNDDKFVIIGSSNLWELMTYQEAVEICIEGYLAKKTEICCEAIIKVCEGRVSRVSKIISDVSVLVFFINST